MRAISTLEVTEPSAWALLAVDAHLLGEPSALCREISDERGLLAALEAAGLREQILIRYARRPPEEIAASSAELSARIATLDAGQRRVLASAQRHALDDVVIGLHAWDPEKDAPRVRRLVGAGLILAPGPKAQYIRSVFRPLFERLGREPSVTQEVHQRYVVTGLVQLGLGYSLLPRSAAMLHREGIVYLPLSDADAPMAEMMVAWIQWEDAPPLVDFLSMVRRIFGN